MSKTDKPAADSGHEPAPHDDAASEPLGPVTPDHETALGDTPEAHDEMSPHDLPIGHPGRQAAEQQSGGNEGTTRGHEDPSEVDEDA